MNSLIFNSLRFIGLVLLQVLILNQIEFIGYVNPFVYILFIMMLPLSIPGWLLLLLGFGTGYTIDLFMTGAGLHTAATVFMAFARPYVIQLATGAKQPETVNDPGLSQMGMRWWFSYTLSLVVLHHFALFLLESFSFSQLGYTLIRIILSVIATELLILLLSYFFSARQGKK
ncbi:MAG TPA: rod shape-determining protein MreD [Bacteroidales bacterium]|nr:rod shape-determining protein MreD [Bacteroidales bacterium]